MYDHAYDLDLEGGPAAFLLVAGAAILCNPGEFGSLVKYPALVLHYSVRVRFSA
jgi:hypothetical protein